MKRYFIVALMLLTLTVGVTSTAQASPSQVQVVAPPVKVVFTDSPAATINCYSASHTVSYFVVGALVASYSMTLHWCFKDYYGITSYTFNHSHYQCCGYQWIDYEGKVITGGIGKPSVSEYEQSYYHACLPTCTSQFGLWNRITGYGWGYYATGGWVS